MRRRSPPEIWIINSAFTTRSCSGSLLSRSIAAPCVGCLALCLLGPVWNNCRAHRSRPDDCALACRHSIYHQVYPTHALGLSLFHSACMSSPEAPPSSRPHPAFALSPRSAADTIAAHVSARTGPGPILHPAQTKKDEQVSQVYHLKRSISVIVSILHAHLSSLLSIVPIVIHLCRIEVHLTHQSRKIHQLCVYIFFCTNVLLLFGIFYHRRCHRSIYCSFYFRDGQQTLNVRIVTHTRTARFAILEVISRQSYPSPQSSPSHCTPSSITAVSPVHNRSYSQDGLHPFHSRRHVYFFTRSGGVFDTAFYLI